MSKKKETEVKTNCREVKNFYIGPEEMDVRHEHSSFKREYEKLFYELMNNRYNENLDINIYINNSPGGNLFQILSLIDLIKDSKCNITTYCSGFIASAATLLFMSGHKKIMFKNSHILFHEAFLQNYNGDLSMIKLQTITNNNKKYNKLVKKYLSDYCNLPDKYITKIFKEHKNVIFKANKALKIGIIDSIN